MDVDAQVVAESSRSGGQGRSARPRKKLFNQQAVAAFFIFAAGFQPVRALPQPLHEANAVNMHSRTVEGGQGDLAKRTRCLHDPPKTCYKNSDCPNGGCIVGNNPGVCYYNCAHGAVSSWFDNISLFLGNALPLTHHPFDSPDTLQALEDCEFTLLRFSQR
ncbi:hypothetical protein HZ326_23662 [Fusarium oxysporum f. sp. albedinis]|nr:hypothetical protein HZ326_23662 [Fusarium oxysporum f. sp. albedinis]